MDTFEFFVSGYKNPDMGKRISRTWWSGATVVFIIHMKVITMAVPLYVEFPLGLFTMGLSIVNEREKALMAIHKHMADRGKR